MLPKANRLTSDYDFRKVRRQGRKIKTSFFDLYVRQTRQPNNRTTKQPSRFGFVVSLKLDKRATKRNRLKRVFREEIRAHLPRIKEGFDCAFWVKKRSLEAEPDQVRRAIEEALGKAGLLTKVSNTK